MAINPNPTVGPGQHVEDHRLIAAELAGMDATTAARVVDTGTATGAAIAAGFVSSHAVSVSYGNGSLGVVDATAHIQSRLDAASAAGGGIVFVPAGVYLCSGITVPKGVILSGAQPGDLISGTGWGTVIRSTSGRTGDLITVDGSYARVTSLMLDGRSVGGSNLRIQNSPRSFFEDLYIRDAGTYGIYIGDGSTPSHANKYHNISVIGCGSVGVRFSINSYDSQVTNLWIGECGTGLRIESGNNTLTNLHSWGNTGNGVEIRSNNNRLTAVYLETNGSSGLNMDAARDNLISGGDLWKNLAHGAFLSGTSDRNRFVGITAYTNGQDGFRVSSGNRNLFVGCTAHNASATATQDYGFNIVAGDQNIIDGCLSRDADNVVGGLSDTGTHTVVRGGVIGEGVTLERTFIAAPSMSSMSGSGALGYVGTNAQDRVRAFLLDAASAEAIGTTVMVPSGWKSVQVDLWWTNADGGGAGDCRWQLHHAAAAAAGNIVTTAVTSTALTATAPAAQVLAQTSLGTFAVTNGDVLKLTVERVANHAGDTLANDAAVVALAMTRVL